MRKQLMRLIQKEITEAKAKKPAAISLKLNSLSDELLIEKLYEAAKAGVVINMVVRGIFCMLTENSKFKDFFSAGFKMFVIVTLIMVFFVLIFFYLNPQITDTRLAENNKLLLSEGNYTPAEIDKNANQMKRIFIPMMLGITTFMYLFLGALITAITAAFLSSKK